ncbi:MAG TPA: efflux RND transporter periplasmic adaptor subunit [Rectinemataceae bacterium]|nr:efflux RND transporter periplasmic adaptor subunit [Rectinemataceae bacterium]
MVLTAGIVLASCAPRQADPVAVKALTPRMGKIADRVEMSGVLVPNKTVTIFPKLVGIARSVAVDTGDRVAEGQVLVQIDAKELLAQLQVAEASVQTVRDQAAQAKVGIESARLNLDMAQKNYDRTKALLDSKSVTQSAADDAQTKLDLAKAAFDNANRQYQTVGGSGLAQAEAQANLIRVQISNSTITSPISGTVVNRNLNLGELTSTSTAIMTIADTGNLKLQGTVPQGDVFHLAVGDKVRIRVDGMPDREYEGTISQLGPIAATTGQYFPVSVGLRNDGRLLAGMTAVATVSLSEKEGLIVPLSAVERDNGKAYVFTVVDGLARKRLVSLGASDGSEVQIISGIKSGELVATSNVSSLEDGSRVAQ